jgi:hypothetical protein
MCGLGRLQDTEDLPTSGQWHSMALLSYEIIMFSSSDRKCFLYVLRLPSSWQRLMAFNRIGGKIYGSAVIGMGCTWAVSVCHNLHRNMLLRGHLLPSQIQPSEPLRGSEIRKSRINPNSGLLRDKVGWQVYVDNFDDDEIFNIEEYMPFVKTLSEDM